MTANKINVLQFITPVGFYGAERWILALVNNSDPERVRHDLVVTQESANQDLEITEQFPQGAGRAFRIPMKGRFDPRVIAKLSRIIRERNIDLIHTHGYKSDILGLITAKKNSIACISTPHGFGEAEDLKLKTFIKMGVFSYRFMDQVVPLSQQLVDEVLARGTPESKIKLIRNAVDLTEIEHELQQEPELVKSNKPVIGYIGRFDENKNVKDIIKTFDAIWQKKRESELVLIGDGETRADLEQLADSLPSKQAIRFLGFRHDRLKWMRDFSLFMLASKNEGIPRCLMECMAMGIPVVAYDIPGVNQLVTQDETGLLAPYGDLDGMISNCRKILEDDRKADQLAENGREFIYANYSGKRMAGEYLDVYQNTLQQRQAL